MHIRQVVHLAGPNIWANYPVLEAWVDIGHFEDLPSNALPGFSDRLKRWLPGMVEHRCSVGERGGFFKRLDDGTWLGHVLEHVTLELMSLAHLPVGFGRARETSERGVYKVVVRCDEPEFGRACLEAGRELVLAAAEGRDFELAPKLAELRELADRVCLGPSTHAIVSAAKARDIPAIRLSSGNLVQLGYAKAQRRIWTAETDGTSAIAEGVAQDKELTRRLLSSVGVPVPQGRSVSDAEDAWRASCELGLPVVVKPRDGNHGRGVSIHLVDREGVITGYELANQEGSGVVVERFVPGTQHRVLVVGERAIACASGEADQVVGDGVHSVQELVEHQNLDPARGEMSSQLLTTIVIDDIVLELLKRQGLTPASVPAAGRTVVLRYNGDLTVDETARLHPEVAADCVLAAQTVGLDIAGIDLIAENIARPLPEQNGAILEVNASPGLVMHLKPLVGSPQPVGEAIVDQLFDRHHHGRVPLVAVSGTNGKTITAELVGAMLAEAGHQVGSATSRGVRVGTRWLSRERATDAEAARRLLINPFVDAVVLEISEASVLSQGLAFDRCSVSVVTNQGSGDYGGLRFVDRATLGKALRAATDVVLPNGYAVLNADDPDVCAMAEHTKGRVLLFGQSPVSAFLSAHLAGGGRAVTIENGYVVACQGDNREVLFDLGKLRCPSLGLPAMLLEDVLAAAAAGVALGLGRRSITLGLQRALDAAERRGSAAWFARKEARALVAPVRNAHALEAWGVALGALGARGQLLAIALPSDATVEDTKEIGNVLAHRKLWREIAVVAENASQFEAFQSMRDIDSGLLVGQFRLLAEASRAQAERLTGTDLLFVAAPDEAGCLAMQDQLLRDGWAPRPMEGVSLLGRCR